MKTLSFSLIVVALFTLSLSSSASLNSHLNPGGLERRADSALARRYAAGTRNDYDTCSSDYDCVPNNNIYCYHGLCRPYYYTTNLQAGEHCMYQQQCLGSSPCAIPAKINSTSTDFQVCIALGLELATCTDTSQCQFPRICNGGSCRTVLPENSLCTSDYQCQNNGNYDFCYHGYCRYIYYEPNLLVGDHCASSWNCAHNAPCAATIGSTNTDLFVCQPLAPLGGKCDSNNGDNDCAYPYSCRGGKCRINQPQYAACKSDYDCSDGNNYCLSGFCHYSYGNYNLGNGSHCSTSYNCLGNVACLTSTTDPTNTDLWKCALLKPENAACTDTSQCEPPLTCGGGKCRVPKSDFTACTSDYQCPGGYACLRNVCKYMYGDYFAMQPGEHCSTSQNCQGNQYCSSNANTDLQTCHPLGAQGDSCNINVDCTSPAVCNGGACYALKAVGAACTNDFGCTSGFCSGGACRDPATFKVALGGHCHIDIGCGTGNICVSGGNSVIYNSNVLTCVAGPTASKCVYDSDCPSGAACRSGKCKALKDPYDPCTIDGDCSTGFCLKTVGGAVKKICIYQDPYYINQYNSSGLIPNDHCFSSGSCNGSPCAAPAGGDQTNTDSYVCQSLGFELATCSLDADCQSPRLCRGGKCRTQLNYYSPCTTDYQCSSGFCTNNVCYYPYFAWGFPSGHHCFVGGGNCLGYSSCGPPVNSTTPDNTDTYICQTLGLELATCAADSDCNYPLLCRDNVCRTQRDEYAACDSDSECATGYCYNNICRTNIYQLPANAHCSPSYSSCAGYSPCAAPAGSDPLNTDLLVCQTLGLEGANCTATPDCQDPLQCREGLCRIQKNQFESCASDFNCIDSFCYQGMCRDNVYNLQPGEHCEQDYQCDGASPCGMTDPSADPTNTDLLTCQSLGVTGDSCAIDSECQIPGSCRAGICVTLLPDYLTCSTDYACSSGYCLFGLCRNTGSASILTKGTHCNSNSQCASPNRCKLPTGASGGTDKLNCGGVAPTTTTTLRSTTMSTSTRATSSSFSLTTSSSSIRSTTSSRSSGSSSTAYSTSFSRSSSSSSVSSRTGSPSSSSSKSTILSSTSSTASPGSSSSVRSSSSSSPSSTTTSKPTSSSTSSSRSNTSTGSSPGSSPSPSSSSTFSTSTRIGSSSSTSLRSSTTGSPSSSKSSTSSPGSSSSSSVKTSTGSLSLGSSTSSKLASTSSSSSGSSPFATSPGNSPGTSPTSSTSLSTSTSSTSTLSTLTKSSSSLSSTVKSTSLTTSSKSTILPSISASPVASTSTSVTSSFKTSTPSSTSASPGSSTVRSSTSSTASTTSTSSSSSKSSSVASTTPVTTSTTTTTTTTTSRPLPTTLQSGSGFTRIGCFVDDSSNRLLPANFGRVTSASACLKSCQQAGLLYCGTEAGGDCYGSNILGYSPVASNSCITVCSDTVNTCGGTTNIELYQVGVASTGSTTTTSSSSSATPTASTTTTVPKTSATPTTTTTTTYKTTVAVTSTKSSSSAVTSSRAGP